jgi:hypothetical protein
MKIGISLLIALCFIIPSGTIMAGDQEGGQIEAVEKTVENNNNGYYLMDPVGRIDRVSEPVVEQDTNTYILSLMLENPAGEFIYVHDYETDPIEEFYQPWLKLYTDWAPSVYEPEIDLYRLECGETYCIYETSFEDNADNYLEWGQIDLDCLAPGGYYDGWAWSDARASDGDHSFKCTMYDEYKNMQQDKLYLKDTIDLTSDDYELCDGTCIDVDGIQTLKIEFDTFVAGEYADDWPPYNDAPLDFLQLGYYSCEKGIDCPGLPEDFRFIEPNDVPGYAPEFMKSDTSPMDNDGDGEADTFIFFDTSMGLYDQEDFVTDYRCIAEKIDGSPGWWHVWAELEVDELEIQYPENFGIFFEWESDKERVFEGAYVDNVKISIVETVGEKIYQSHSQDWLVQEEVGIHYHKFADMDHPRPWNDVEPGIYKAIVKIKSDTGDYSDTKEFKFKIGDVHDCAITMIEIEDDYTHDPIPDGGMFTYPSNAHIKFDYHNAGNMEESDIKINARGYELKKEVLFEDNFDGMSSWPYFYEDYPLSVVAPPDFTGGAWSGGKSLYLGNPQTWHIEGGNGQQVIEYIGYSEQYFSMECVDEAYIDFYYKAALPEGAGMYLMLLGAYYVVPIGGTFMPSPICQKSWVGPMQPQCRYASLDFKSLFDILKNNDYMLDENGHMTWETGIGFYLSTTNVDKDAIIPECCFAPGETTWSGVFIDDVSIKATVRGDVVWQDSMVIPGPCEPCEVCNLQFDWEDVPFSNYQVEVEAECEGDVNTQNDKQCSSFYVLDEKEKMSKATGVDCTVCEPEAWCVSDVVGNDCANDHYALATNCETHEIPEFVNDYVTICPGGSEECCEIDVSHLQEGDDIWLNATVQVDIAPYAIPEGDFPVWNGAEYYAYNTDDIDFTLELYDSFGDGWVVNCNDGSCCGDEWDLTNPYTIYSFISVYKNENEIINDATIWSGDFVSIPFTAQPEDQIKVFYRSPQYEFCGEDCCCTWEDEIAWRIVRDSDGKVIAEDGFDENCIDCEDGSCPIDGMFGPWHIDDCESCHSDKCECPQNLSEWTKIDFTGRFGTNVTGNYPGECIFLNASIPVGGFDRICLRWRLDTMAALYDVYQAMNPGFTGWAEIPGIGFHIHQMSLDGVLDDSLPQYIDDSILYNFEDGTMHGCQGPALQDTDPLAPGYWRCNVECYDCEYDPDWNLVRGCIVGGEYWEQIDDFVFRQEWPAQRLHNYLIWETEIEDCYEAYLYGEWAYEINDGQELSIELSADGGENWYILNKVIYHGSTVIGGFMDLDNCKDDRFQNYDIGSYGYYQFAFWHLTTYDGPIACYNQLGTMNYPIDLTPWVGQSVLIRVKVDNLGVDVTGDAVPDEPAMNSFNPGWIEVRNFRIMGKQDFLPPMASISLSGNMIGPGLYAGPVTATITATDNTEVKEIHYILDGTESVVEGDKATVKVNSDGEHTIEYWAVDGVGNEGPHNTVTFTIDATPPSVTITAPEPGLYLFGNQLLSMNKVFIIGAFTIEAVADDAQGVNSVEFFLNDDFIAADVEAPYSVYCAIKNMGSAMIKAVASDTVGNTAEDSLEVTYYKFL